MKYSEEKQKLEEMVESFNKVQEEIVAAQNISSNLRLEIAKQQGKVEALEFGEKGKKDAKT